MFAAGVADADQPVAQGFGVVQRAGGVEGQVVAVKTAGTDLDLMFGLGARALGHHIDHAPRLVLPVKHRRRALEHFDAFQGIGVYLRGAAQAARRRQIGTVKVEQRRGKAAAGDFIGNGVAVGVAVGAQPRGVAQRLGQVAGALLLNLVGGDHVDGLRDFQDRRVGLGGGGRAGGDKAVDVATAILANTRRYVGRAQIQRPGLGMRVHTQGAAVGHAQAQATARQRTFSGLLRGVHAIDRRRGLALQQGRRHRQGQVAIPGDAAQGHAQRRGRQVKKARGALFAGHDLSTRALRMAGNAQGDGQRQQAGFRLSVRHGASFLVAR